MSTKDSKYKKLRVDTSKSKGRKVLCKWFDLCGAGGGWCGGGGPCARDLCGAGGGWCGAGGGWCGAGGPCARSRFSSCHYQGLIYIHGGRDRHKSLSDLWCYHPGNRRWSNLRCHGVSPGALQDHSMVAYDGQLFVFGGSFTVPDPQKTPLWIYQIGNNQWREYTTDSEVKLPGNRRGHTALVHAHCMYVFGGYVDLRGSTNELWVFDFGTESWHLVLSPASPTGRHDHAAVATDQYMIIMGGRSDLNPANDMWIFAFESLHWCRVQTNLAACRLQAHAAATCGNQVVVFGGEDATTRRPSQELWLLDTDTLSWQCLYTLGPVPPAQCKHALLLFGSSVSATPTIPESDCATFSDTDSGFGTQRSSRAYLSSALSDRTSVSNNHNNKFFARPTSPAHVTHGTNQYMACDLVFLNDRQSYSAVKAQTHDRTCKSSDVSCMTSSSGFESNAEDYDPIISANLTLLSDTNNQSSPSPSSEQTHLWFDNPTFTGSKSTICDSDAVTRYRSNSLDSVLTHMSEGNGMKEVGQDVLDRNGLDSNLNNSLLLIDLETGQKTLSVGDQANSFQDEGFEMATLDKREINKEIMLAGREEQRENMFCSFASHLSSEEESETTFMHKNAEVLQKVSADKLEVQAAGDDLYIAASEHHEHVNSGLYQMSAVMSRRRRMQRNVKYRHTSVELLKPQMTCELLLMSGYTQNKRAQLNPMSMHLWKCQVEFW